MRAFERLWAHWPPRLLIASPDLLPPGADAHPLRSPERPLRPREYGLRAPGMREPVRVTTDPAYYAEHTESVELWSPGSPLFTPPDIPTADEEQFPDGAPLAALLDE